MSEIDIYDMIALKVRKQERELEKLKKELKDYDELQQENERLTNELNTCMIERNNFLSRIEKATKDLFELKDIIYKPETRDENIPIQQKISSIIKQLNGRSDE